MKYASIKPIQNTESLTKSIQNTESLTKSIQNTESLTNQYKIHRSSGRFQIVVFMPMNNANTSDKEISIYV